MNINPKKLIASLPTPFWVSFYIFLFLIVVPALAYIGTFAPAAPGSLTVAINQKSATTDPNPSYTSVFTVQFSEAIDSNTFTNSDITLSGTAPGQAIQSITEAGSFNKTTYEVRIQATSAGTIQPSIAAELITTQSNPSNTNQASTSTDNSVTYNGDWAPGEFVMRVSVDGSISNQFKIPRSNYSLSYDYNVDCDNDGTLEFTHYTDTFDSVTCSYASAGEYDIVITGLFPHMDSSFPAGPYHTERILDVLQWGTNQWQSMSFMFYQASNLQITAIDAPNLSNPTLVLSGATGLDSMFSEATSFNSNINHWDVSHVTSMRSVFDGATAFNQSLNNWDTSSVTNMFKTFIDATSFNQPLDQWNVSDVTNMSLMFYNATSFNQSLNDWDVSHVTDIADMFYNATAFNQPLNDWDTSSVVSAFQVFMYATSFNQPLNNWDVSGVTSFIGMFRGATSFNQPLNNWDVSNATSMAAMFYDASSFNRSLADWDVSNVTDMSVMFTIGYSPGSGLSTATYDATLIGWSTQNLQHNVGFSGGRSRYCNSSTQRQAIIDDFGWTIVDHGEDCTLPFITTWKTDNPGVSASNQILISTDGYSSYYYSVDWGDGNSSSGQTGDATHTYASPGTYIVSITGTFPHMQFNSGGQDSKKILSVEQWGSNHWQSMSLAFQGASNLVLNAADTPDLSSVTDMSSMFAGASSMNTNINSWDVSNIMSMSGVFSGASSFNQPLNSWDTSSVTGMVSMFKDASSFNQPLNSWDTSNVTNMQWMFLSAESFDQSLASWDVSGVTNMQIMFGNYDAFLESMMGGLPFENWPAFVQAMYGLPQSGLSTPNYDATLIAWSQQSLQGNVTFDAGTSTYCNAELERQNIIDTFTWTVNDSGKDCSGEAFITTWKTDNPGVSASNQITIPIYAFGGYNYDVDWGDGNTSTEQVLDATHTYASAGTYTVQITGDFPHLYFCNPGPEPYADDALKLLTVEQWGTNHWTSMACAFGGAQNLTVNATDVPDLSGVTDMSSMFNGAASMNTNINDWDTSTVTNMSGLFAGATAFNQPLNNWDVSNAADMSAMFSHTDSFDQPLNTWDTSNVTDMSSMFQAASFNQDIHNWDTSNVTIMRYMFDQNTSYNQPLDNWNVGNVVDMYAMFSRATVFNQPLDNWDVSSVVDMEGMFADATAFNGSLDWDTSSLANISGMFIRATAFNQPLNSWDVSDVTDLDSVFYYATSFNQPLDNWNIGNVTRTQATFYMATSFNQPLDTWNVSNVTDMKLMFIGAISFDQSLAAWYISNATDMMSMFGNFDAYLNSLPFLEGLPVDQWPQQYQALYGLPESGLSTPNYDATLISWSAQALQDDVIFDAGTSKYCTAANQRQSIIDNFGWTINDAGLDCTPTVIHITDCAKFQGMMMNPYTFEEGDPNGYYVLDNDIDCSETATWTWSEIMPTNTTPIGFLPTADPGDFTFGGTLDGQGYTVSNIFQDFRTINLSTGIFEMTWGAQIKNITFEHSNIRGSLKGGGSSPLAFVAADTIIENVHVKNLESHVNSGDQVISGLVSQATYGTQIIDSSTQGAITADRYSSLGRFSRPEDIAIPLGGTHMYIADTSNSRIQDLYGPGTPIGEGWPTEGSPRTAWGRNATDPGDFYTPNTIAIDNLGTLYVNDSTLNRIQKFDLDGHLLGEYGFSGKDIALDNQRNIFVLTENSVKKYDNDGIFLTEFGSFNRAGRMTIADEQVYVTDLGAGQVQKFSTNGVLSLTFGSGGSGPGQITNGPDFGGIAVDGTGNIFVVDSGNNRVEKFDSTGTFIAEWNGDASGMAFDYPAGITISTNSSDVYVVDRENNRIVKFDSGGEYIAQFGSYGTPNTDMAIYGGLAGWMDGDGGKITRSYADLTTEISLTGFAEPVLNGFMGGGLAGVVGTGEGVDNTYAKGSVTVGGFVRSNSVLGGITGQSFGAPISNSYTTVDLTFSDQTGNSELAFIGGAIGGLGYDGQSNIANLFVAGAVTGPAGTLFSPGSIVGVLANMSDPDTPSSFTNHFFDQTLTTQESCVGASLDQSMMDTPLPTGSSCTPINPDGNQPNYFKNNSTNPPLNQWNFTNIWKTEATTYPTFIGSQGESAPSTPLSLSLSNITTTSMQLNWLPPSLDGGSPITSYQVQYKLSSSNTWISAPLQGSSPTSHIFTNLSPNTSYNFRVSAINAVGSSPYTDPITGTTLAEPVPPNPPQPPQPPQPPNPPQPPVVEPPVVSDPPVIDPDTPTTNTETNTPVPRTPVFTPSPRSPSATPQSTNLPILGAVIGPLVDLAENLPRPVATSIPYSLLALLLALSGLYGYSSHMENQRRKAMQALIDRFKALLSSRAAYLRITSHYISTPITKMQGTIELLAGGITATTSSTSRGKTTPSGSRFQTPTTTGSSTDPQTGSPDTGSANSRPGSTISPSSTSSQTTSTASSSSSSSEPLPPPAALAATATTLTFPEGSIVAAQHGLKSLADHAAELLTEGQSLTGRQQANISNLEKKKGLSFLTHPAFWLPIVIISTIVTLLNIIFIQADRYAPTAITIFSQLLLGFVGVIALGVSYYFYRQRKEQRQLLETEQDIETEFNARQTSFIADAASKLNDDLLILEGVAKDIQKYPKVAGFTNGLTQLKQIVTQLEKLELLSKNVPGLTWKTDLSKTVAHSIQDLQAIADKQSVTITTTNVQPGINVAIEEQALNHLISAPLKNAITASQAGKQVEIAQVHTTSKDKDHPIQLTITDHGIGIPAEKLKDIFAPFNAAHSLERFSDTGLGLDLYLCKVIAEQYGATISIDSQEGEGTEVGVGVGEITR